jgi:hypothetical protein
MKVVMDDETEAEGGPGDIAVIPPGRDPWVVGNARCFMIDFAVRKIILQHFLICSNNVVNGYGLLGGKIESNLFWILHMIVRSVLNPIGSTLK